MTEPAVVFEQSLPCIIDRAASSMMCDDLGRSARMRIDGMNLEP